MKGLEKDLVLLEIQDDGVGFDKSAVELSSEKRGSLGLKNMSERTEMVDGIIRIESAVGKGTTIRVVIPLTSEATERLQKVR
jgi:signal transduction histidine kinase